MIEIILYFGLLTFGTLFGLCLISLRKFEIENKKLRMENTELLYARIEA
jgi:membrane protein CcdC involved in cytochrome C biogenesis